ERETRICVVEDSRPLELQIEREERVVGGVYKAKVVNVLQGMDAAFVDIGLERNAFLYVGDVLPTSFSGSLASRGKPAPGPVARVEEADSAESGDLTDDDEPDDDDLADDIEYADDDQAAEEAAPVAASASPTRWQQGRGRLRRSDLRDQRIRDVVRTGQELLVQVIKGPRSTKGARVSTRISLPGRYLVLMPEINSIGISRKIEDARERDRLRRIADKLRPAGAGIIVRTEAEDKAEEDLVQDIEFLKKTWSDVQIAAGERRAPALVQQDLSLLYKTIRDIFGSDVDRMIIDDPAEYEKANDLLMRISPGLAGRIQLYDGREPIFDHFGLEEELDRLTRRKVFMKNGGSLVIDETEALTVIDVNTSRYVGGASLNETILKTNVDAADEIARQLRLRDIGGIIVIDFIDMSSVRDKQTVLRTLESALRKDRSRTRISGISGLGLVEMTRKRTGETLTGFMTDECPYCNGRGHLPSAESVTNLIERDLRRMASAQANRGKAFIVRCHTDVAELLIGPESAAVEELERLLQCAVFVRADDDAHLEKYSIKPADADALEAEVASLRASGVTQCRVARSLLKEAGRCVGWAGGLLIDLDDSRRQVGQTVAVKLTSVRRSWGAGELDAAPRKEGARPAAAGGRR
ncbi:MAG: Rne/Rng family ribonuclease, partial [Armatimonadetes bacterium]|nr:Rne/Rng family ribonuclease [Armatimonadota bacterium]